jgi:hypothetical protein
MLGVVGEAEDRSLLLTAPSNPSAYVLKKPGKSRAGATTAPEYTATAPRVTSVV